MELWYLEGDGVGLELGNSVGNWVGPTLGEDDGPKVGLVVGTEDGADVELGELDGDIVGLLKGAIEGVSVDWLKGIDVSSDGNTNTCSVWLSVTFKTFPVTLLGWDFVALTTTRWVTTIATSIDPIKMNTSVARSQHGRRRWPGREGKDISGRSLSIVSVVGIEKVCWTSPVGLTIRILVLWLFCAIFLVDYTGMTRLHNEAWNSLSIGKRSKAKNEVVKWSRCFRQHNSLCWSFNFDRRKCEDWMDC